MNIYLQVEASTGNLFEYSKTEKEGFDKHEALNKKTGTTTVSYRKYHKEGAFGTLLGVSKRQQDMGAVKVDQLAIALEALNGDRLYISMPLFDPKGDIQTYAVSFLSYLPNLKIGTPYRIFPYAIEDKAKNRKNYGVSVKIARLTDNAVDDVNQIPRLRFEIADKDGNITTAGEIPRTQWVMKLDKVTADNTNRNEYLWKVLMDHQVGEVSAGSTKKTFDSTAPADAPAPVANPVATGTAPEATAASTTTIANGSAGTMVPNADFDKTLATAATAEGDDEDEEDLPF
jgi:hypothetical protein